MNDFFLQDTSTIILNLGLFVSIVVVTFLVCKYVLKLPEKLEKHSKEILKHKYRNILILSYIIVFSVAAISFIDMNNIYLEYSWRILAFIAVTVCVFFHYTMRTLVYARKNSSIDVEEL